MGCYGWSVSDIAGGKDDSKLLRPIHTARHDPTRPDSRVESGRWQCEPAIGRPWNGDKTLCYDRIQRAVVGLLYAATRNKL